MIKALLIVLSLQIIVICLLLVWFTLLRPMILDYRFQKGIEKCPQFYNAMPFETDYKYGKLVKKYCQKETKFLL